MAIKASDTITLVKVSDGATGPAGKGIKSTAITYQAGTSGTTAPTGTWSTTIPSVAQGQYLWSRTIITYTDNTTSTAYSVTFIPKNGATGATGTGVNSIAQQYYLSTSKTSQSGGSWVTTMPTWSSGKYLWTRYAITYKNPTSTTYTSPICDSSWEAVNEIQVGGRNYFTNRTKSDGNGKTFDANNEYTLDPYSADGGCFTQFYNLTVPMSTFLNKKMVIHFYAKSPNGAVTLKPPYNSNGKPKYPIAVTKSEGLTLGTSWTKVVVYFKVSQDTAEDTSEGASNKIEIYAPKVPGVIIKDVMVEEATIPSSSYIPAPEDMATAEGLDSLEETTNEQLSQIIDGLKTAEIAIDNIENTIKLLVVDENGETMVTQDGEGLRVDMAPIINKINNAIDRLGGVDTVLANQNGELESLQNEMETVSELNSYVQVKQDDGVPYIELGNSSSFKVKITNTAILFMNGGDTPAYMDKDKLLIRSAEIEDELVFGGFAFKERENKNMGLIWKE